ncbi:hypothetical protein DFH09DRAFT_1103674 [Mycena vulgaris]|nr:hypothetical protein DFH09DRAFT_1103674 [Mycena vulgaris]
MPNVHDGSIGNAPANLERKSEKGGSRESCRVYLNENEEGYLRGKLMRRQRTNLDKLVWVSQAMIDLRVASWFQYTTSIESGLGEQAGVQAAGFVENRELARKMERYRTRDVEEKTRYEREDRGERRTEPWPLEGVRRGRRGIIEGGAGVPRMEADPEACGSCRDEESEATGSRARLRLIGAVSTAVARWSRITKSGRACQGPPKGLARVSRPPEVIPALGTPSKGGPTYS